MRWRSFAKYITAIVLLMALIVQPVFSRPEYMKEFRDYPEDVKKCTLCHVQSSGYGGLNAFGRDFAMEKSVTKKLLDMDSDGDGYDNRVELNSGTFPGNPDSYPGREAPGFPVVVAVVVVVMAAFLRKA
ncbi:thrombospondin type 3 repeat-containing protein [Geoglobus sp.]